MIIIMFTIFTFCKTIITPEYTRLQIKQWLLDNNIKMIDKLRIQPPFNLPFDKDEPHLKPQTDKDEFVLDRIKGMFVGLALGDAISLAYSVNSIKTVECLKTGSGGIFDDLQKKSEHIEKPNQSVYCLNTGFALCAASSLLTKVYFDCYDQIIRFHQFFKKHDHDFGEISIVEQKRINDEYVTKTNELTDAINSKLNAGSYKTSDRTWKKMYIRELKAKFKTSLSINSNFSNFLMRLAPIIAVNYRMKQSVKLEILDGYIMGSKNKYSFMNAAFILGAMITHILNDNITRKDDLLDYKFYTDNEYLSENETDQIYLSIFEGSYKTKTLEEINKSPVEDMEITVLEQLLWVFWNDNDNIEIGMLKCLEFEMNVPIVANIYGQLAGAFYGRKAIHERLLIELPKCDYIEQISSLIYFRGETSNILIPHDPIFEVVRLCNAWNGVLVQTNDTEPTEENTVTNFCARTGTRRNIDTNEKICNSNLRNGIIVSSLFLIIAIGIFLVFKYRK